MSDGAAGNLMAEKAALRARTKALREALDPAVARVAGQRIQESVLALPEFKAARRVGCYLALEGEVPTEAIVRRCRADGKQLCVPAFDRERRAYGFMAYAPGVALERGPLGISQPAEAQPVAAGMLEFVVVPGVAFDALGGRVGHGGGHYDRMLIGAKAFNVAVAYDFQIADRVPMGQQDVRMDVVVTETRVLRANARGEMRIR